jgi:hypothetical protein
MKPGVAAPLAFLWTSIAFAQQVASVDLTRPPGLAWPAEKPNGCERLVIGMGGGGYVEPEDHKPHEIVLELSNIKDVRPIAGSELKAEVKLRNSGKQPIQIPWSTDPSTIENGQNPDNLVWDVGTFEFALRNQTDDQVRLKSLTEPLFGSTFSPGSLITIQPGAWITAVVKFKLKDEYGVYDGPLKAGKWQLSAEWQQSQKQRRLDGCRATTFDLRYKHYYQQQNPSVAIQIIGDGLAAIAGPRN